MDLAPYDYLSGKLQIRHMVENLVYQVVHGFSLLRTVTDSHQVILFETAKTLLSHQITHYEKYAAEEKKILEETYGNHFTELHRLQAQINSCDDVILCSHFLQKFDTLADTLFETENMESQLTAKHYQICCFSEHRIAEIESSTLFLNRRLMQIAEKLSSDKRTFEGLLSDTRFLLKNRLIDMIIELFQRQRAQKLNEFAGGIARQHQKEYKEKERIYRECIEELRDSNERLSIVENQLNIIQFQKQRQPMTNQYHLDELNKKLDDQYQKIQALQEKLHRLRCQKETTQRKSVTVKENIIKEKTNLLLKKSSLQAKHCKIYRTLVSSGDQMEMLPGGSICLK